MHSAFFVCNKLIFLSKMKFTSAATNDNFMLQPSKYVRRYRGVDRAYIDYEKI